MKVLITNDDGIYAPGLWALVKEFKKQGEVVVVAPDREQSAVGTAITLHHPLRVQKVKPEIPGVETYAIGGTPGDSVIMGISKLAGDNIDLVISGINNGPNTGDDVLISGTVGGAMQAYLHGISSIAVSINEIDSGYLSDAAGFTALMANKLDAIYPDNRFFFNINIPGVCLEEIGGIKVTRLSSTGYNDSVEEGYDGRRHYYWIKHQKATNHAGKFTDAWALAHSYISLTPLHACLFGKIKPEIGENTVNLLNRLRLKQAAGQS